MKRLKRTPGQTDVRLNSSTRQLASDPRSQTAEPQNNKCDVAASCPHSILVKRLECCADRLNPPRKPDLVRTPNPMVILLVLCNRARSTAMQDQVNATTEPKRVPWNKGKLTGAKPPLRPKHVWSIRTKLQIEGRARDL